MYTFIKNPITNRKVNINNKKGREIINKYIKEFYSYQFGGNKYTSANIVFNDSQKNYKIHSGGSQYWLSLTSKPKGLKKITTSWIPKNYPHVHMFEGHFEIRKGKGRKQMLGGPFGADNMNRYKTFEWCNNIKTITQGKTGYNTLMVDDFINTITQQVFTMDFNSIKTLIEDTDKKIFKLLIKSRNKWIQNSWMKKSSRGSTAQNTHIQNIKSNNITQMKQFMEKEIKNNYKVMKAEYDKQVKANPDAHVKTRPIVIDTLKKRRENLAEEQKRKWQSKSIGNKEIQKGECFTNVCDIKLFTDVRNEIMQGLGTEHEDFVGKNNPAAYIAATIDHAETGLTRNDYCKSLGCEHCKENRGMNICMTNELTENGLALKVKSERNVLLRLIINHKDWRNLLSKVQKGKSTQKFQNHPEFKSFIQKNRKII